MGYAVRQLEIGIRAPKIEGSFAPQRGRTPHTSSPPLTSSLALQDAICVTASTEYELRDGICRAVRDRRTGAARLNHHAIGMQLARAPQCGEILHLVGDCYAVLMTSKLEEVRMIGGLAKRRQRAVGAQLRIARSY